MTAAPDLIRIARMIEDEAVLLRAFNDLLRREEGLLIEAHTDALLTLAGEKTELYRRLQRLYDERALLLGRLGLPNSDSALRTVCRTLPDTLARWDEVLELARDAQQRNSLNGQLIAERLHSNQAALAVLMAASDGPQLYGADGHARPSGGGRILGRA